MPFTRTLVVPSWEGSGTADAVYRLIAKLLSPDRDDIALATGIGGAVVAILTAPPEYRQRAPRAQPRSTGPGRSAGYSRRWTLP